jgi:type IV secretion system protein VirD4
MTPTKLLIGQILVVFTIVIAGVWLATERCAAELSFQPQLAAPWFAPLCLPVYRSWQLFAWWSWYDAYAPAVFNKAGAIAASSGLTGCAVAIVGSLWRARQNRLVTTYGSSRWATAPEIEAAGLFRAADVFLRRLGGKYLRHDGPEHVMAFAPTHSGKGVGLVIPNLATATLRRCGGRRPPRTRRPRASSNVTSDPVAPFQPIHRRPLAQEKHNVRHRHLRFRQRWRLDR